MDSLYDRLLRYGKEGRYPFHMPGHKRSPEFVFENPFSWDITEIEGFDDLHHPRGILKEAMADAAAVYGARSTFFLVNGSSCGLLAAIQAAAAPGETVLIARNCHKSVYFAMLQGQLQAAYLYPQKLTEWGINGGILPEDVERLLRKRPDCRAVILTSPTYEGVVSDVEAIAGIVHRHGAVLLVDEAHGAHFSYGGGFPASALERGADLVIQSLHKTLPSLTQTALLHVGRNCPIREERLQKFLSIYESSSPSYVLLASVDQCIRYMAGPGRERLRSFRERLLDLRRQLAELKTICLLEPGTEGAVFAYDPSKLYFRCPGKGIQMEGLLRQRYGIEPEMTDADGVLLMTSLMDREEGLERLVKSMKEMDQLFSEDDAGTGRDKGGNTSPVPGGDLGEKGELTLAEAFYRPKEPVLLEESEGRISGEFVYLYPPGIPVLVPGERITGACLSYLLYEREMGALLKGMEEEAGKHLLVLSEQKGTENG